MTGAYYELKRVFHMSSADGQADLEAEYQRRITSAACLHWDFPVGGYPLFCMLTAEIAGQVEAIFHREIAIGRAWAALPVRAQRSYLYELLVDEVVSTNEIEGIHSTRKEIELAISRAPAARRQRFYGFSQLYLRLADGQAGDFPHDLDGIRALYDVLLAEEIAPEDRPDGRRFRAGPVSIMDGRRRVHSGFHPETQIDQGLSVMLATRPGAGGNGLVNAFAGHFMFESVHPFYDGNGRLGRFLLSVAVRQLLSTATALTLSRLLAENKRGYYKAFSVVEEPFNRAEVTFFVQFMLGVLDAAQEHLLDAVTFRAAQLVTVERRLSEVDVRDAVVDGAAMPVGLEIQALAAFAQVEIFAPGRGLGLAELAEELEVRSPATARKYAGGLVDRGLLATLSRKPLRWSLSDQGRRLVGLSD